MRISKKITLLAAGGILILGILGTIFSVYSLKKAGAEEVARTKESLLESRKEKLVDLINAAHRIIEQEYDRAHDPSKLAEAYRDRLKDLTDTAYSAIEAAYNKEGLTEAQKKQLAMEKVRGLRYQGSNYFWITDTSDAMVMHPIKPALDGKNMSDFKDPNGKRIFNEMSKVSQESGEGFVDYMWPKPGEEEPSPKLSFVKMFKPWGWIVGTGVYLEAAEEMVKEEAKKRIASLRYGNEGKEYFWINDLAANIVMHPIKPELDGKDMSGFKDPKDKFIFVEFANIAKQDGEGFVDYMWDKLGDGVPVAKISYVKLFKQWGWVVGTGLYLDDIEAQGAVVAKQVEDKISGQIWTQAGLTLFITIVATFAALLFSRRIATPISNVALALKDIAEGEGDLTKKIECDTEDEVGEMASWFNVFVGQIRDMVREIAGNAGTIDSSSNDLSGFAEQMAQNSDDMSNKSQTVAAAAEEMSSNMSSVAAATEQFATNLNMVATASEEMSSTIKEIATNAAKARDITQNAVDTATSASTQVSELGEQAREIDKVTLAINEISEQTKLLALNATIEAARAGEAGKGFAVVAGEIKELARQTAESTGEITDRVDGIRTATDGTIEAIQKITEVISDVNAIVVTIAAAVEEQSVTTNEITTNVTQASSGVTEVNSNVNQGAEATNEVAKEISHVSDASAHISESSSSLEDKAKELSGLATALQTMVSRFKVD